MTPIPNELLKDPLFQLNVVLWLAQPLPADGEIIPLFYKQGFTVYAIAPLLAPPPDSRLAAQEARLGMQERVRPDVVVAHESGRKFGFIECKASSFGPTSSQAEQARSLLVVSGPRAAEVLGLAREQVLGSLLAFVMPQNERQPLTQTLSILREELDATGLPSGSFSVLGLVLTDTEISIAINDQGSTFFALPSGINPFMKRELEPILGRFISFLTIPTSPSQSKNEYSVSVSCLSECTAPSLQWLGVRIPLLN